MVRVAIVGGGFAEQVLVPAFRSDGRARVDLICVSSAQRAAELAARANIPRSSGDWQAAVTDEAIDIVAIAVPPALQAEIAIAAARAGKHVFAEKPLATSATEAQAMCAALTDAQRTGAVDFEFREIAAFAAAKELLAQGAIGRVRHAYLDWRLETWAYRGPVGSWKRDPHAGGGTMNLFVSHALDSVVWMLGPIARVAGRLSALRAGDAESRVDAWLELVDGTPVTFAVAADATGAREHRISIHGDDGALFLENRTDDYAGFSLSIARRGEPVKAVALPSPPPGDGRIAAVASVVRKFLDAIATGSSSGPTFNDGLLVQRAIDALRTSQQQGTWQRTS